MTLENTQARLVLPSAPESQAHLTVKCWSEPVTIKSYMPAEPNRNPMFLERRVYQGSSGRVYPLPFIDRIATEPEMHVWQALHIENEYLRVMMLPEIGGRIHVALDKRNGYDFFYRQNVIKPALVGLAGPWTSGGVEFNWPQHHRPGTFSPVSYAQEREVDGSATIWCGDYDRMSGLDGAHGVCLRPGRSVLELKVQLYNPTSETQTFLWWANAAVRVHEFYQSFFPEDVQFIADHAKRALSRFPHADSSYYGVPYAERARNGVPPDEQPRTFVPDGSYAADDLSWYANIPVPTSYMVLDSKQDFFGGYDHRRRAGFVHVADHHIAPGKKQWTWGNHEFGYAWDRNLTEEDGPYIELMAGVYTDNQPDFSYLAAGETRRFQQFWYPVRELGPAQMANVDAALHVSVNNGTVEFAVNVTRDLLDSTVTLLSGSAMLHEWKADLCVSAPAKFHFELLPDGPPDALSVAISSGGVEILRYVQSSSRAQAAPATASAPKSPDEIASVEELFVIGLHLEQYRHATRSPEPYWREALRRDPLDSQCNTALGRWHFQRGEFVQAQAHLERAIQRLTLLNSNPRNGEPFYALGLTLWYQGLAEPAYDAFYKATWSAAWRAQAYFEMAGIRAQASAWSEAFEHLEQCLRTNADHLPAQNLMVCVLRRLSRDDQAKQLLDVIRAKYPLDPWSRYLNDRTIPLDDQQALQLAFSLWRGGQSDDALDLLARLRDTGDSGVVPIAWYTRAWWSLLVGEGALSEEAYRTAEAASPTYCFPHRLDEMVVLEAAIRHRHDDARAKYYLANLLYNKGRQDEAAELWKQATTLDPLFATAWRNLGIAAFNVSSDGVVARSAFASALKADAGDARVLFEQDQLWKRLGESPATRLAELLRHPDAVQQRDDLAVEVAALFNLLDRPMDALLLLGSRTFQPWEGGEGLAIEQHVKAHLLLGISDLVHDRLTAARGHFTSALVASPGLGEAKHLLVNQAEIYFWLGELSASESLTEASSWWERAVRSKGDFQGMSVRSVSEATYWSALSLQRLGRSDEADLLLQTIEAHANELESTEPFVDYFATSLPAMLLFNADLRKENRNTVRLLRAQVAAGRGGFEEAIRLLESVLQEDRSNLAAVVLQRELQAQVLQRREV